MSMIGQFEGNSRILTVNERIVFKGAIYHITQRAPGNEYVFLDDSDYLYFLKITKEVKEKYDLKIFAFSLLPNHLHLLIQIQEMNLSVAMKNLFERYANFFNWKYNRKGHVFCGRFRACLCLDDAYFLSASVYIHLNPFRAGLCKNFKDYRWSSIKLYEYPSKVSFVSQNAVLNLISSDLIKASQEYKNLLVKNLERKVSLLTEPKVLRRILKEEGWFNARLLGWKHDDDFEDLVAAMKIRKRSVSEEGGAQRMYVIKQLLANGYKAKEIQEKLDLSKSTYHRELRYAKQSDGTF